ncbi:hypothetical protein Tco_0400232, partial [Tanacetum coccineum]
TMADVNVNAPAEQAPAMAPPTRTDDQILPRIRWVPIGKSNCYLDVERSQSNPIYKIAVDILKHTNFFRAFTASLTIPSIYIQQFWDTVRYDNKTGSYSCQLDEQWFDLTKETLRDSLQITPVDTNNAFSSPPTPDALIKFVNDLGYPKVVRTLSDVVTNDMFQPWRALTTVINLCYGKVYLVFERTRAPVVADSLREIVIKAHNDYAERITVPRPGSPLHLPIEEPVLGYLKFSAKGTKREVFGMPIPNDLINNGCSSGRKLKGSSSARRVTLPTVMSSLLKQTELSGHDESSSLYAELGLTDSETDSDEEVSGIVARVQDEGQAGPNPGEHDEGQWPKPWNSASHLVPCGSPGKDEPEKANTESKVSIQWSLFPTPSGHSFCPSNDTPVIDLTVSQPVSKKIASTTYNIDKHLLYNLENLDIPHKVSKAVDEIVTDAVDWAIQAPLRDRFRDLPEADIKEILHHRMWESNSYQAHEDHKMLYEALEKSMTRDHTDQLLTDLVEAQRKKKKRHDFSKYTPLGLLIFSHHKLGSSGTLGAFRASGLSQLPPPPPPPPSTNQSDQSTSTAALSSSNTAVVAEYTAWTTTDTRLKPSVSSIPEELHMDG